VFAEVRGFVRNISQYGACFNNYNFWLCSVITFAAVSLCWKLISTVYDEFSEVSRTARMSVWRLRLSGVRSLSIVPLDT